MKKVVQIKLKKNREQSVLRHHPWIFSGGIAAFEGNPENGSRVSVQNCLGEVIAHGHYFDGSIAVRILSFDKDCDIPTSISIKMAKAFELRKSLDLVDNPKTNIYRLIHGEGDQLSGLIIDVYGKTFVIQCHTIGIYRELEHIVKSLIDLYGPEINIFDKSADLIDGANPKSYLHGSYYEENWVENGYKFQIDWDKGQKTGFFIDQRNNRALVAKYAKDKMVANLFSYSGGFSVYAQGAGAKEVISVDASAAANELARKNFNLNFDINHEVITADAIDYIRNLSNRFDVIVLDPPAFAKHLSAKHKASQAYKRINSQAIKHIRPGGILFTFSCSQVIDSNYFKDIITAASIEVGRNVRILHQLSQPEDHPINIFHPESNYLKGLVLFVE